MNQKILIMFSGVIDMKASEGHDAVNGVSVEYYFFGENGEAMQPKISVDGTSGTRRGKVFMTPDMENKISFIPGIYDGTFEMKVGSDGKPVLKLVDINFLTKAAITAVDTKEVK